MAVAAEGLLVAQGADPVVLVGSHAMIVGEQGSVVVAFEINRFFLESVAFGAEFPSLAKLKQLGMSSRHAIDIARRTGNEK